MVNNQLVGLASEKLGLESKIEVVVNYHGSDAFLGFLNYVFIKTSVTNVGHFC